jgi:ssDNA-binding Zn-finger/Zn-ribbon topoisomerase 1
MKCPKCGSKMIKRQSLDVYSCTNSKCYNNESIADMEELEWVSPGQQRLERVLSKFKDNYLIFDEEEFQVYYFEGLFRIKYDNFVISLDTVESLIKDLERNE